MVNAFEIVVRYDSDLREQLEAGSDDPLGWIDAVYAGDQALIGGEDSTGMKDYLVSLFGVLLQSVTDALDGESAVVRTGNGPVYIALEPCEGNAVTVSICYSKQSAHSPEARESYEPTATVRTGPLVEAVIETASEFEAFALITNPDLAENSAYEGLRADIKRAEEVYGHHS